MESTPLNLLKSKSSEGGGDEIIQTYYRINSTQEIRSPIHKLKKLSETDKGSGESLKVHWWNLNRWNECSEWDLIINELQNIGSTKIFGYLPII